ncbi:MAG: NAD-dependent epimerase/dehydratase family protein [Pseudorhodoplanes sp.]|nr:NAD-dependent epimerase/dehydratase family protein [Pseudorhodoplanes sp.]
MTTVKRSVLVTGGAGYVGSVLVPRLLDLGHTVTVLDLYMFGHDVLEGCASHPNLIQIVGDLRHPAVVKKALAGCDSVIHLACISNDPSFELDPALGKSINYDAFRPLVRAAKEAGIKRFIYASSSSVYGVKDEPEVSEDLPLEPLTDYSRFKAMCEQVLEEERAPGFATLTIRPATVCGYAPRQRLDVIVNILTNHAINNRRIKVFGGGQFAPQHPYRRHGAALRDGAGAARQADRRQDLQCRLRQCDRQRTGRDGQARGRAGQRARRRDRDRGRADRRQPLLSRILAQDRAGARVQARKRRSRTPCAIWSPPSRTAD